MAEIFGHIRYCLFRTVSGQSISEVITSSGDIFEFRYTSVVATDTTAGSSCVRSPNQSRFFREGKVRNGNEHSRERCLAALVNKALLENITSGVVEGDEQETRSSKHPIDHVPPESLNLSRDAFGRRPCLSMNSSRYFRYSGEALRVRAPHCTSPVPLPGRGA